MAMRIVVHAFWLGTAMFEILVYCVASCIEHIATL